MLFYGDFFFKHRLLNEIGQEMCPMCRWSDRVICRKSWFDSTALEPTEPLSIGQAMVMRTRPMRGDADDGRVAVVF